MKRVIGFALICFALGVIAAMLLTHVVVRLLLVLISLFIGYNLFCCE